MTQIELFILIILIHYLADFALQTHEQATKKGEGNNIWNRWLAYHVSTYTLVWAIMFFTLPIVPELDTIFGWLLFVVLISVPHYITDWLTSRIGSSFWKSGDFHNGFCVVGADQIIHYLCLIGVLIRYVNIN